MNIQRRAKWRDGIKVQEVRNGKVVPYVSNGKILFVFSGKEYVGCQGRWGTHESEHSSKKDNHT